MWLITFRDLQWRRRRFTFGVVGTALVFAVTLLLAGLSSSLRAESRRTIRAVGADGWVVREGVTGPFSGLSALPPDTLATVAAAPGVEKADPIVIGFATADRRNDTKDITVFGYQPDGLGAPPVKDGRQATAAGEAVVDKSLGVKLGEKVRLRGQDFTAVGRTRSLTLRAGIPNVYIPMTDAQNLFFEGNPLISSVLTKGRPNAPVEGLAVLTAADARADLMRPFKQALKAIDVLRILLWMVAAAIVGTVIYLSVLERIQDFAVLKAIGTATKALLTSLVVQAMVVSVLSAGAATGLARLLAPGFPLPISLTATATVAMPVIAIGIGILASLVALRRAVGVDPAVAFGAA